MQVFLRYVMLYMAVFLDCFGMDSDVLYKSTTDGSKGVSYVSKDAINAATDGSKGVSYIAKPIVSAATDSSAYVSKAMVNRVDSQEIVNWIRSNPGCLMPEDLTDACKYNYTEVAKVLLYECGVKPSSSALNYTILNHNVNLFACLILAGCPVGRDNFVLAYETGGENCYNIVELLISCGIQPQDSDLIYAISNKDLGLVTIFLQKGRIIPNNAHVVSACRVKDEAMLGAILKESETKKIINIFGKAPLYDVGYSVKTEIMGASIKDSRTRRLLVRGFELVKWSHNRNQMLDMLHKYAVDHKLGRCCGCYCADDNGVLCCGCDKDEYALSSSRSKLFGSCV